MTEDRPRQRLSPWWWVASIVGLVVVLVGLVAWLAMLRTPTGERWLTEPVLIIVAGGLVGVGSPVLGSILRISSSVAATEEHVVNSHSTRNLRDDIDELLALARSTEQRVGSVEQAQERHGRDILGIRDEIGQLRRTEREQWAAIEQTADRRRQQ